jgi:hypothetical protein
MFFFDFEDRPRVLRTGGGAVEGGGCFVTLSPEMDVPIAQERAGKMKKQKEHFKDIE